MLQPTLDQRSLARAAGGNEFDQGGVAGRRPGGVKGGEFVVTAEEVGSASGEVGEVGADRGVLARGGRFGLWRRKRAGRQR